MTKKVIIINGSGGVGKDTICETAARFWKVKNISSITPILQIARVGGWTGEKTPEARRMLSKTKAVFTEYNDLPFAYCMEEYNAFRTDENAILFVHIREPEEIERFRKAVGDACITLLVRRTQMEAARGKLGNHSDDDVERYAYHAVFDNDGSLEELPETVKRFFTELLEQ